MITRLYKLLHIVKNKKLYLLIYRCIKIFLNTFYPIYCRLNTSYKFSKIEENVIVSMTSFPARIDSLWITVETILRQTHRPEMIILWLAESQFNSLNQLPKRLLEQQNRGLVIKFCDDLRSHKKYYYSMKNFPSHIIITVDDDTFYPENLVENLIATHKKHPNTICCNLAHLMTIEDGEIAPYINWISGADGYNKPSDNLVPIGCEGVLYPPGCLNENVFDKEQIKKLCPLADDIWLKAMATLNGVKAIKSNSISITYANLLSAKNDSLNKVNVEQNMNDIQIDNILKYYPELKKVWK
jgi:hypothetical protein